MDKLLLEKKSHIGFCQKNEKTMSKEEIYEKVIAELFGQDIIEEIKKLPNEYDE
jgi:hypothetical protein